jgi:4-azaleucine resistance transporter AzlC
MTSRPFGRQDWIDAWEGCLDALPLMVGGVPFGLACGLMGVTAGFTPLEVVVMSALVYSGSAQSVAISMAQAGSAVPWLAALNAFLLNMHNLVFGASLVPYLAKLPWWQRLVLSSTITDAAYAATMNRTLKRGYSASYHLAVSMTLYLAWLLANLVGATAGNLLPNPLSWGLDFTLTAVFIAILVPKLQDRVTAAVAAAAALTAILAAGHIPGKWYILLSCVVAAGTGLQLEKGLPNEA